MSIGVRFQGGKDGLYSSFDRPRCDLARQPSRDHVNEPFLHAEVRIRNRFFLYVLSLFLYFLILFDSFQQLQYT